MWIAKRIGFTTFALRYSYVRCESRLVSGHCSLVVSLKLSRAKKTPSVSSREATLIALAAFGWPGTNVTSEKPQYAPLAHPYCSLLLYTRKITLTYVRTYVRFAWADKISRAIAPVRSQPYERILKLSCVHYTYVRGAVSVLRASERSTHPRNFMRHAEWK